MSYSPGTAATDLFRARTGDELRARFRPLVDDAMAEVGLARLHVTLVDVYDDLPPTDKPEAIDLGDHVTEGALDGVFTMLAREETAIRHDPLKRTTALLREVFGRLPQPALVGRQELTRKVTVLR